jgi:hypothetical protein
MKLPGFSALFSYLFFFFEVCPFLLSSLHYGAPASDPPILAESCCSFRQFAFASTRTGSHTDSHTYKSPLATPLHPANLFSSFSASRSAFSFAWMYSLGTIYRDPVLTDQHPPAHTEPTTPIESLDPIDPSMSDFRVSTLKRYRLLWKTNDKYTLQCPFETTYLDPELEVPVRQRGGDNDNQVFFAKVKELEVDDSRDRRHNMDAQAKIKRTYGPGLLDGTLVWLVSAQISPEGEQKVGIVSLLDYRYYEVSVADVLCRPDRISRSNTDLVITLVGPTYADGTNRRGNQLICQNVIEQQLDTPGIRLIALKKSDVEDKYTHVKKDRCIDLLNMRERALRDAVQQRPRTSSWLETVTDVQPDDGAQKMVTENPNGYY